MGCKDTSVSSGSRIQEVGSAIYLREEKAKGKETDKKAESISSFTTSKFSLTLETEVEMKRAMRELSESNQIVEQVLDVIGCLDDSEDADFEESQSTVVFRTPKAMMRKGELKREQERSG